jgi:hypothetical protein
MDTNISEPKQGPADTADLLQQQPHVEVIDIKSSAASSDEERLAAGISTIGLQTKRLSGAQRKRLTRGRKMKEGNWMENKPPRKTPSQKKVAGKSMGALKDPTLTRAHHLRLHSNHKNPGALNCRLGRTRKLLLVSRWRLLIDAIQMLHWIRPKLT